MKDNKQEPVNKEGVRMLAIELGAREAARRLGIKENTVLSWARRGKWKLPKRKGGGARALTSHAKPGDALIAAHEDLERATRAGLMQALRKAAEAAGGREALDVENAAQLRDVCLAAARVFGWRDGSQVTVNTQVNVKVADPERQRLIDLRNEALAERDDEPATARPAPAELSEAERELRREGWPRDETAPPANVVPTREPTPPGLSDLQRFLDYPAPAAKPDYRPDEVEELLGY
jgi:hypothetical protein